MNSSLDQSAQTAGRPSSGGTRQRLLHAAAEVLAEVGWGRVTTRAVAQRAGLPLGTVSYHFRGKQELLTQAALEVVERILPLTELAAVETLPDLLHMIKVSVGSGDSFDPVLSAVLIEAMRESGRDHTLRERMAMLLADYRGLLTRLVLSEQQRGAVAAGTDPAALATLIAAAGDGLVLHTLLDSEIDTVRAFEALLTLLRR